MFTLCLTDPFLLMSWYWELSHMTLDKTAINNKVHSHILNVYNTCTWKLLSNFLLLHSDKKKALLLGLQATRIKLSDYVVTWDDLSMTSSERLFFNYWLQALKHWMVWHKSTWVNLWSIMFLHVFRYLKGAGSLLVPKEG